MRYVGGKEGSGVFQRLINLMPPHLVYVEPFLGGGAVMRMKRPAVLNVGRDLVPSSVLAVAAVLGISDGLGRGQVFDGGLDLVGGFDLACGDGLAFLEAAAFGADVLVYCDPPYLLSTRTGGRRYVHEFEDGHHRRLLRWALAARCMVLISGYWSQLYASELAGWTAEHYPVMTRGGTRREEWAWYNYPRPVVLHDYGFLGAGFRERERIARRVRRWVRRLAGLPVLERNALLSAMMDPGLPPSP